MNKAEVGIILAYLYIDVDKELEKPKVDVWFDVLKEVPFEMAKEVARSYLANSEMYGQPSLNGFCKALEVKLMGSEWQYTGMQIAEMVFSTVSGRRQNLPPAAEEIARRYWKRVGMARPDDMGLRRIIADEYEGMKRQEIQFARSSVGLPSRESSLTGISYDTKLLD